jgi:ABC-type Fe3+/spermidine/putrescine transport system ATPase subunit
MSMASRLAVMHGGRVVQVGTPHEVYERPVSRFVADFIGIANILAVGDGQGWLALRPEKIVLSAIRPDTAEAVAGNIVDIAYEGDRSLYRVALGDGRVIMVATANVTRSIDGVFHRGQDVWLGWAADAGHPLAD